MSKDKTPHQPTEAGIAEARARCPMPTPKGGK